ncbi:MAG TPA: rhodanese-like domain-containing protein [Pseudacidobacterium sp.]|jgi:rhodanese-related sulfurtransferase|nr:rhodanese-like domain-containing protein [Pseudacidobacterium sp.]
MYSGNMLDYEITPQQLSLILSGPEKEKTVLLDVREPGEYAVARIEGSILMPMGDVPGRANHELDPDAHIVTICHHGVRSMNVAVWLRNQGFEQAQSLRGGIDAWASMIDPAMARY